MKRKLMGTVNPQYIYISKRVLFIVWIYIYTEKNMNFIEKIFCIIKAAAANERNWMRLQVLMGWS